MFTHLVNITTPLNGTKCTEWKWQSVSMISRSRVEHFFLVWIFATQQQKQIQWLIERIFVKKMCQGTRSQGWYIGSSRLPKYSKILNIFHFPLWPVANLANSSCAWSLVWLHHKIEKKKSGRVVHAKCSLTDYTTRKISSNILVEWNLMKSMGFMCNSWFCTRIWVMWHFPVGLITSNDCSR
jgi:hypothetical protein